MIKAEFNLFEVEMKVGTMNTSVMIEPSLGITEETFKPVDMGSSADILLFSVIEALVFPPEGKKPLAVVVVSIIDASTSAVFKDERKKSGSSSVGNREGDHSAISLIHPEYQLLSFISPASFALSSSVKEGFIELKFPGEEGLHLLKKGVVEGLPGDPEDLFSSRKATGEVEPRPVSGNAQAEEIEEVSELVERDAESLKVGTGEVNERIATTSAPKPLISSPKLPLSAPMADSSSTPFELDKKSPTFWQAICQGNCLFCKYKSIISEHQFLWFYSNLFMIKLKNLFQKIPVLQDLRERFNQDFCGWI